MLFIQSYRVLFLFFDYQSSLNLVSIVYSCTRKVVHYLNVGIVYLEIAFKSHLLNAYYFRINCWIMQVILEILYVLNLTRLCYAIPILFESLFGVKIHHFLGALKYSHKQEEAAYYCPSPSLSMITMKHSYPFGVLAEVVGNQIAYFEEHVKWWRFMILPIKADNILQYLLIDSSPRYIDCYVFIFVLLCEQLSYGLDIVPIHFFYS